MALGNSSSNWRRLLRLSLRGFLLAIAVFCVVLAVGTHRAHRQQRAVQAIISLGGQVTYDWQLDENSRVISNATPSVPKWLIDTLGPDFFCRIEGITLIGDAQHPADEQLQLIKQFPDIKKLTIFFKTQGRTAAGKWNRDGGITEAGAAFLTESFQSLNYLSLGAARLSNETCRRLVDTPGLTHLHINRADEFGGDTPVYMLLRGVSYPPEERAKKIVRLD